MGSTVLALNSIHHHRPPPNLNTVVLESPSSPASSDLIETLDAALDHLWGRIDQVSLTQRWVLGLAHCMAAHEGF